MNLKIDSSIALRIGVGPAHQLVRWVLVAYLSPAILIVLAIGLVGLLAEGIGMVDESPAIGRRR